MQLIAFNGGINTRVEPNLLNSNEAVALQNVDDTTGVLTPIKKPASNAISMLGSAGKYAYFFEAINVWISSSIVRHYVEYDSVLYYTENSDYPKSYYGITEKLLGINVPNMAAVPVLGAAGVLTGTYQYVYTYYNSTDGIESGPSPLSAEIVATSDQIVVNNIIASVDPQVDQVKLYRIGGGLTNFSLVFTLVNGVTTYTDNTADASIPGNILTTTDYIQAPFGLQFLIEAYGMLFGIIGRTLYFTEVGKPWAWSEFNTIQLATAGTGIAVGNNGILVFTKSKTYLLTGATKELFTLYPFDASQGCLAHRSIAYLSDQVLWVSNDGVCGSTGAPGTLLTLNKLGKTTFTVKQAVVHDSIYYLLDNENLLHVFDFRFGGSIKKYSIPNLDFIVTGDDKLLGFINGSYYELFKGDGVYEYNYKSPLFLNGSYTERKQYKFIYVRHTGNVTVRIYIDGVEAILASLTGTTTSEIKIPEQYKDGYSLQLEVFGTGKVHEINWLPKGRAR